MAGGREGLDLKFPTCFSLSQNILDLKTKRVFILYYLIRLRTKKCKSGIPCEIDIQKAYDHKSWIVSKWSPILDGKKLKEGIICKMGIEIAKNHMNEVLFFVYVCDIRIANEAWDLMVKSSYYCKMDIGKANNYMNEVSRTFMVAYPFIFIWFFQFFLWINLISSSILPSFIYFFYLREA